MDQHELKISEDDGNLEVRQTWDETGVQLAFGQVKRVEGLTPDDFRMFIEQWDTIGIQSNASILRGGKVATDNGVDTIICEAHAPWPISNRITLVTKYMDLDIDGSHMMLTSSDGNQRYLDDPNIYTQKDKDKLVLAYMYQSGFWVKPLKDAEGNTVATNIIIMQ